MKKWTKEDSEKPIEFFSDTIESYKDRVSRFRIDEEFNRYVDSQKKPKDTISQLKSEVSDILPDKSALLLKGSAARWEFMPKSSDYDFTLITCNEYGPFSLDEIESKIVQVVGHNSYDLVGVPYHPPIVDSKSLFGIRTSDVAQPVGGPNEFAWAESVRVEILFESVFVAGDKEFIRNLRREVKEIYDIDPSKPFSFKSTLCIQIHILKTVLSRLRNEKYSEGDLFKTTFSRIISFSLNVLAVHSMFWFSEIYPDSSSYLIDLRAPPLAILINLIYLDGQIDNLELTSTDDKYNWFPEKYDELISDRISDSVGRGTLKCPLLESYVEIWRLTRDVRSLEDPSIDEEDEKVLKREVYELSKLVRYCEQISKRFIREKGQSVASGIMDDIIPTTLWHVL